VYTIIKRAIKDHRYQLIAYIVGALIFLEMYISLFPTLQKQAKQLSKIIATYPAGLMKAFNIDPATLTFSKLGPYLGMEQFNFVWPVLAIIFAISFANYSISGEIEKGTIEILLAQPVSRLKLFFSRYLAGFISLLVFSVITIFAIIPFASIQNIPIGFKSVWVLFVASFLFAWAIYGLAFLGSAIFSEKGKASILAASVLILMYVLNILGGLDSKLKALKYLSFFYYYNPTTAMEKYQFVGWSVVVFVGVALISTILAALWFNKRDVAI
jgi:ABC-2 type transport system permease protein